MRLLLVLALLVLLVGAVHGKRVRLASLLSAALGADWLFDERRADADSNAGDEAIGIAAVDAYGQCGLVAPDQCAADTDTQRDAQLYRLWCGRSTTLAFAGPRLTLLRARMRTPARWSSAELLEWLEASGTSPKLLARAEAAPRGLLLMERHALRLWAGLLTRKRCCGF